MAIEKGSKVKASNTCKTVTIKMNCEGYPKNVPLFKMSKSPEIWEVRQGKRVGVADTRKLRQYAAEYIQKTTGTSLSIQNIIDTMILPNKNQKGKVNAMHHKRPTWAGGTDDGANLEQLTDDQHHAVHDWMDDQLSDPELAKELKKKLSDCDKASPVKDASGNDARRAKCMQTKKGETRVLKETTITSIAKSLSELKEPVTLQVEMTCDCAVSNSNQEIF